MVTLCKVLKRKEKVNNNELDLLNKIAYMTGTALNHGNTRKELGDRHNYKIKDYKWINLSKDIKSGNTFAFCKVTKYKFNDKEHKISDKMVNLLLNLMSELYKKDPKKFSAIKEDASNYNLDKLFNGAKIEDAETGKRAIVAPRLIPNIDEKIYIETKSSNDEKIKQIKRMLEAMKINNNKL